MLTLTLTQTPDNHSHFEPWLQTVHTLNLLLILLISLLHKYYTNNMYLANINDISFDLKLSLNCTRIYDYFRSTLRKYLKKNRPRIYRISPCIMRCFFLAIHVAKSHLVLYIDVEFKQIFSSLAVSSAVSSLAVERIGQSACLVSRPIHTIQQDCAFPTSSKQQTFTQCWYIVGPPSSTLTQQCSSI